MQEQPKLVEALERRADRQEERRNFFRSFGAVAAVTGGLALAAGAIGDANAQSAPTDTEIFNFALNLEYLEATFYSRAVLGNDLDPAQVTGTGTLGTVNTTGARQVTFTDPGVAAIAREITANERAHVAFVRTVAGTPVARPALDLSVSPTSAFSQAARAAGLIGANESFDPYANDENFLLAGFLFEDVGVTAYKGASPLITSKTFLEGAAGVLAVEAYHASMLRTTLFRKGIQNPALINATEAISTARDSLDGPDDRDQGVRPIGDASNIAPLDGDGLAFSRTTGQVLNIVYLNRLAVTSGGFFPAGVNGSIRTSAAN